jgi:hypothetical protein
MEAEIKFLFPKVKLSQAEKYDLEILKNKATSDELLKQVNSIDTSINNLNKRFQAQSKKIENMSAQELYREFDDLLLQLEVTKSDKPN